MKNSLNAKGYIKASGSSGEQPSTTYLNKGDLNTEEQVNLLKTQNESLAAKIDVNNTKLHAIEDTLDNKLQDMFEDMQKKNPDYIMNQKIGALEKEMIDLKNELKKKDVLLNERLTKMKEDLSKNKGGFGGLTNSNMKSIKKMMDKENEDIVQFLQEFVDEEALHCITVLSDQATFTCTQKMDSIDWMVRNIEFVSPKIFKNMIKVCKDIYTAKNRSTTSLYYDQHQSIVLTTMKTLILETQVSNNPNGIQSLLPQYLGALEILLMSEFNQEQAMELEYQDLLMAIMNRPEMELAEKYKCIDCFSMICMRGNLINKCVKNKEFATFCANLTNKMPQDIKATKSIYAIMKQCFQSNVVTGVIVSYNQEVANNMIRALTLSRNDTDVLKSNLDVRDLDNLVIF